MVGYQRTRVCRASLEPNAMLPHPKASVVPAPSVGDYALIGDAPRRDSYSVAFSEKGSLYAPWGRALGQLGHTVRWIGERSGNLRACCPSCDKASFGSLT